VTNLLNAQFIRDKRKKDPNYKLKPKNSTMGGAPGSKGDQGVQEEEKEVPGVDTVADMEVRILIPTLTPLPKLTKYLHLHIYLHLYLYLYLYNRWA
jgi:hypothetical protein